MFVWSYAAIIKAFSSYQSGMPSLFKTGEMAFNSLEEATFLAAQYPKAENISIDYAILEQADNIAMIKASFLWNDLGTWSSLHDQLAHHEQENIAVKAQLIAAQAKGNMIYSSNEKLVVIKGLNDFVVVDEKGVLLIYPKGEDQTVKGLREQAKDQFGDELV